MNRRFIMFLLGIALIVFVGLLMAVLLITPVERLSENPEFQEISTSLDAASVEIQMMIQQEEPPQDDPDPLPQDEVYLEPTEPEPEVLPEPEPPVLLTLEEILPRYVEGATVLQQVAEEQLAELIDNLVEEYYALPPEERSKLTVKTGLATKYISLAKDLEARIDDIFYHMIGEMEAQLEENQLQTDPAEELVEEYELQKSERQKDILEKAMIASQE